jgi:hypothetical protein
MGLSALPCAKTDGKGGFREALAYVFAEMWASGQFQILLFEVWPAAVLPIDRSPCGEAPHAETCFQAGV